MPTRRDHRRWQAQLDRLMPAMRREVEKAFATLKRRVPLDRLVSAIELGDDWALRTIVLSLPLALRPAMESIRKAVSVGITSIETQLRFAVPDTVGAAIANQTAARMVVQVTRETQRGIAAVIAEAFKGQIDARKAARMIRPMIGLTERMAKAVVNRQVRNTAKGWTAARVTADTERYSAKLLKARAEMIARTEIQKANTAGQIAGWKDAQRQGRMSHNVEKVWIVTPDDKLCPQCEPLDGERASLDATFPSTDVTGPPLHPNCRCSIGLAQAVKAARRAA